jgi:hypothetical protein
VWLFYQHCFTKVIVTFCCDEKPRKQLSTTPLVKNTHTLVTENTQHCHKLRKECNLFKFIWPDFSSQALCFLPNSCENICRDLRLMLPNA